MGGVRFMMTPSSIPLEKERECDDSERSERGLAQAG
jgi:hypothetical protein